MSFILMFVSLIRKALKLVKPKLSKRYIKKTLFVERVITNIEVFLFKSIQDEIFQRAGALAYASVIAIVPALSLSFAVFTGFRIFDQTKKTILDFIFKHFIPSSGELIQNYFNDFTANTAALSIFGIIAIIITTVSLFISLDNSINKIWHVHKQRPILNKILIFWGVITLGPILLTFSLSLGTDLQNIFTGWEFFASNTAEILSFLFAFIVFFLLYTIIPYVNVPMFKAAIGSIIGVLLWMLLKTGLTMYVTKFATMEKIYGQISIIPIFFIWIFLSWAVVLLCAELVYFLSITIRAHHRASMKIEDFYALQILKILNQHFNKGKGGLNAKDISKYLKLSVQKTESIIDILYNKNFILKNNNYYYLKKPVTHISLYDIFILFRQLPLDIPVGFKDKFSKNILTYYNKINEYIKEVTHNITIKSLYE